jgi:hypothetical protein
VGHFRKVAFENIREIIRPATLLRQSSTPTNRDFAGAFYYKPRERVSFGGSGMAAAEWSLETLNIH